MYDFEYYFWVDKAMPASVAQLTCVLDMND